MIGAGGRSIAAAYEDASSYKSRSTLPSMSLVARSLRASVARASAGALFEAAGARAFAAKAKKKEKKSKSKKGSEDANFEQMLRAIKGQYPDAYVACLRARMTVVVGC